MSFAKISSAAIARAAVLPIGAAALRELVLDVTLSHNVALLLAMKSTQ